MNLSQRILSYLEKNLSKALIVLIFALLLNVVSEVLYIFSGSYLSVSAFLAFFFMGSAIQNVIGAKNGETFNVHIFRRMWLRDHDSESKYEEICLKCVAVMLPISVVWAIVNLALAITAMFIR